MDQDCIRSGDRRLDRETLEANVAKAAGGFKALGVGEDDAVCLMLRNDFAFFEASMGATNAGAYAVPINWHGTAEEVGYILDDCDARALVVHADLLRGIESAIPDDCITMVVETPPEVMQAYRISPDECRVPEGRTDWNDWLQRQDPMVGEPTTTRTNNTGA